ncbi:ATPase associated with various cellular activities AAA family protein [Babesia ovis]|uniref:Midasin n=1 Tax=Babesia ovis TaxID=5869 RepID=A0A9W5T830_BABOV|nr:ATPase associated with various cellular activities AAA family protein [Babesia ovis]
MDESRRLSTYYTRIANVVLPSTDERIEIDTNEVISRLDACISPTSAEATSCDNSHETILEIFGNGFYDDRTFRLYIRGCALSISRHCADSVALGWSKLRFLSLACILNPLTSATIVVYAPDIALSVVVELLRRHHTFSGFIVERLILFWRLRHDVRLRRLVRSCLSDLFSCDGLSALIKSELDNYKGSSHDLLQYKLRVMRDLSVILKASGQGFTSFDALLIPLESDSREINFAGSGDLWEENCSFADLHINCDSTDFLQFPQSNLLCIGQRVSYLRSSESVVGSDFVELPYSSDVLSSMLCHLDVGYGSIVSGICCKEFYIRELAYRVGVSQDAISRIYSDETTDVKSFIGQWICTDKVGEFKFNYGILSTAMRLGRWLIFDENISESIACLLYSVCEKGYLLIPELSEVVVASSNFHVFITTKNASNLSGSCKHLPITYIPLLSESDCAYIVSKRWPVVSPICDVVISTFFSLKDHMTTHRGLNMSDLFKIIHRLSTSGTTFDGYLSSATKGTILEAFYCVLLAGISCHQLRQKILAMIAEQFDIPPSSCLDLLPLNQIKEKGNTSVHLKVLNQLMSCYLCNEPVLLVGETGTGKTAIVQHFAKLTNNILKVYVFSEQSEAEDLIGGFYPDNIADACVNMFGRVVNILLRCCVIDDALLCFLDHLLDIFRKGFYRRVLRTIAAALSHISSSLIGDLVEESANLRGECNLRCGSEPPVKMFCKLSSLQKPFDTIQTAASSIYEKYISAFKVSGTQLQFKFEDGLLIRAMQEGWWILLDEINLASSDLLQRFVGILSNKSNKFELYECGNRVVEIHENFRLFACMNPPTIRLGDFVTFTSGKKDLPISFRSEMTEIFVDEINTIEDISVVIGSYISPDDRSIPSAELSHFYLQALDLCRVGALEDGSFKSPTFTLRNLVRTLHYMQHVMQRSHRPIKDGREALVDGVLSCFASSLGPASFSKIVSLLPSIPHAPSPPLEESVNYVRVEGYWIRRGDKPIHRQEHFIVTPNISKNLRRLCCVLSGLRVPVLLEGPTAAGKTSLVQYLCELTGHHCVRINNHEHTDLSEYLGQFVFDATSCQLRFNYGPIVIAMKEGHWVILDELNLAPSQVLEAINRILDDNREIYVPETGETIKSHPEFMIFATQNPANSIYGGRKQLSKAFCNRFVQLYIEGLDAADLQQVLHQRCTIPLSRAEKIVSTSQALQTCPMNSMAFERHSVLITLRDLIRWANRVRVDDEGLAYYGWCVIAEKLRDTTDKDMVKDIIERCCLLSKPSKPKKLIVDFAADKSVRRFVESTGLTMAEVCKRERYLSFEGTTERLVALLVAALENHEPVLLVGDTGIGKTTICQLLAKLYNRRLNILNLSKNSEASDFIGSFRPVRGLKSFHANMSTLVEYFEHDSGYTELVDYLRNAMTLPLSQINREHMVDMLNLVSTALEAEMDAEPEHVIDRDAKRQKMKPVSLDQIRTIVHNLTKSFSNVLFEWVDGPLTSSMEHGDWFLADEISLAEDAVLEKMNSVLELNSTLTIPEAGGSTLRVLHAHPNFRFLATMNPSGDHGKRELSPALLNRFTVIYIPTPEFENIRFIRLILDNYDKCMPDWIVHSMADIIRVYNERCRYQKLTLRDVIKWAEYMPKEGSLDSFLQGAHLVFLDNMAPTSTVMTLREVLEITSQYLPDINIDSIMANFNDQAWVQSEFNRFEMPTSSISSFTLGSKNSLCMIGKILRALKVDRPILLEGEPGVGKSASISALATLNGTKLIRVNLSEHTDIMDLFGSDMPSASDGALKFVWHNGPVLDAAVNGYWIVLDELNLANQQVLEGLNALLDHRRETFIPELDRFVKCHEKFRLFASQNPAIHGGGRKHLPKSFLNRFTKIYYPPLDYEDYCAILSHLYPRLPPTEISRIVSILFDIRRQYTGKGWEWNLRDCLRLCDAASAEVPSGKLEDAFRFTFMSRLNSHESYKTISLLINPVDISIYHRVPRFIGKQMKFGDVIMDNSMSTNEPPGATSQVEHQRTFCKTISYAHEPILMQSQEEVGDIVSMSAQLKFPVLLVGPGLSGKQSVIKCVAQRFKQPLTEITMLPCFDTSDLLGGFEQVGTADGNSPAGNFRWVDSPLVKSIENGTWVLLSRIHNANPAILDRLNPLLEVGGSLSLNESGDCNRVVHPHPNFRIFMTADSRYVGKVSRAFRNRCIEIHMDFPSSMRPPPQSVPSCPFMSQVCSEISNHISHVLRGSQETIMDISCDIEFKCSTLIDGARLVKSLGNRSWFHCVVMSLCNCVLGSYIIEHISGTYSHYGWSFIKQWNMIDQPLEMTALAASRLLSPDLQPTAFQILDSCLKYSLSNTTDYLNVVTDFLERCSAFEDHLQREAIAAGFDKSVVDPVSILWYMLRSTSSDYYKRYNIATEKCNLSVERRYIDPMLQLWISPAPKSYELQTLVHLLLTNALDVFENVGTPGFNTKLIERLIHGIGSGISIGPILSKIQFLFYLLTNDVQGTSHTFRYISQKVYNEILVMDHMSPLDGISPNAGQANVNVVDFPGYVTPFFGSHIRDETNLAFELHRHGMESMAPSVSTINVVEDALITADSVLSFVHAYVDYEFSSQGGNNSKPRPQLSLRRVDSPNDALSMFFNDRLRFLGCWICHQHLLGDLDPNLLHTVNNYAMGLLNLYIDLQRDLPGSYLAVITGIFISLRKLILGAEERSCTFEIMLDSWSFSANFSVDIELDPLQYMINLVNGRELTLKKDSPTQMPHMKHLDTITSVMLFWDNVSNDNGLPSLQANMRRIDSLRQMLSDAMPAPQWSGLFATLCLVSPIVCQVLKIETSFFETPLRLLYTAITREESLEKPIFDELINKAKLLKKVPGTTNGPFISDTTVRRLTVEIICYLGDLAKSEVSMRIRLIKDLWRLCGLLLISSFSNTKLVIDDIRKQLENLHYQQLSDQLKHRLDTFVTLDTLSDGECCNTYAYLTEVISSLVDSHDQPSTCLRYYAPDNESSEFIGIPDTIALIYKFQSDINAFVHENIKLSSDFTLGCDNQCLTNLRRYLLRHYVLLPEIIRPILVGLDCLSFSIGINGSKQALTQTDDSRTIQMRRVSQGCLQFPFNILKRVNKGDLLSLCARFYDSTNSYDVYCYVNCLIASLRLDMLSPVPMEPLKYAMLALSGIYSRLRIERSEGQSMRMSLLQSCITMAQKNADKGVYDLFPSQQEIIRAIVRDCGEIDEFESLDTTEDEPVAESEQQREIKRITLLCKIVTYAIVSGSKKRTINTPDVIKENSDALEVDIPVKQSTTQASITRQMNAALCLGLACGIDSTDLSLSDDSTILLPRLMSASEVHFGYRSNPSIVEQCSFYRTVDITCCLKTWDIMSRLSDRVKLLLSQFESQQQLLDVESLLKSMCKLKLPTVTQALLVTLLENLVARVHKWNTISHSAISLRELTTELELLILDLRRRELHGWYSVIDDRVALFREDAYSHLMNLVEMCSDMHDRNVPLAVRVYSSVHELVEFVLAAPVAHFEPILDMLRAVTLLYSDSSLPTEIMMHAALSNTLEFLELWQPAVDRHISKLKQETRKEIGELVKRINWSGNDYLSIAALLQKQKTQMSSAMRRFHEGLLQPWSTVYSAAPEQWCTELDITNERASTQDCPLANNTDTSNTNEDNGMNVDITDYSPGEAVPESIPQASQLLETLRSNIEYIHTNKNAISRVQITRITSEVGRLLGERGYTASAGHDSSDWLRWLDFSISMSSKGCTSVFESRNNILRALHIIRDLDQTFKTDKDKYDLFSRNVDLNIYGYLVTMLRTAQSNMVEDITQFQRVTKSQCLSSFDLNMPVYEMDTPSFQQMLSIIDDIYDAAIQGDTKHLLVGSISNVASSHHEHNSPALLVQISNFRLWLMDSPEIRAFNCSTTSTDVWLSHNWLQTVDSFCKEIKRGTGYSAVIHQFFLRAASRLMSIGSTAKPLSQFTPPKVEEFHGKEPILPLECLYLAQLINCISGVEPPAGDSQQESGNQWTAGTGLEDGTGAKNISEDINPDEGMFDNFAKEPPTDHGDVADTNPSVDVDMEFDGDVLDLEGSRECSDIEEDTGGHNEAFEDLQKQQLDTDLVDEEPPLDDTGESLDIEGVSMDATRDTRSDVDGKDVDTSGLDNDYTSEVTQPQTDNKPQSGTDEQDAPSQLDEENLIGDQAPEVTDDPEEKPIEDDTTADPGLDINDGIEPEIDDLDPTDNCQDDNECEQQGESTGESIEEDAVIEEDGPSPDCETTHSKQRKEYEETPYGMEGKSGTQIKNEDNADTGGGSYEEDSMSGSYWGETSRSQAGSMLNFLNTIQRLENPSESSQNAELKLRNIMESMSSGNNRSEQESMLNEVDDSSNIEGLSASMDGHVSHNIDSADMSNQPMNKQETNMTDVSDAVDPQRSCSDPNTKPLYTDQDVSMADYPVDDPSNEMCVDTSSVFTGVISMDPPSATPVLPSQESRSKLDNDRSAAALLWRKFCDESLDISTSLCEQMRMILEPSLKTSLQGDYKTGKRISIKKLMAFIASNYQRDKIWLRRSKPSKRDYRVVLAIDNSRSMSVSNAGTLALKSFACIYQAMSVLEVGELSVCKFGGDVPELLLEMGTGEDPSRVIAGMTFDEESHHSHETGLPELLKYVLHYLDNQEEHRKIVVIISDGKFNKEKARPWIQAAISKQVVPLLVILDSATSSNKSILQMKQVREIEGRLTVETFLSNFPFPYYAVIQKLDRLPTILSDLLRQWFALSNQR